MFDLNLLPEPDSCGQFLHPDIPENKEMTFTEFRQFCGAHGFDSSVIEMEGNVPEEIEKQYFEDGDPDAMKNWIPRLDGDGWNLIAKFDTEDGPVAWFVRPGAAMVQER